MQQNDTQRPIVVKKIKKKSGGGHAAAWKIAYADFVTAMMAFFLLMWLLGSTAKGDLAGIADYFKTPLKVMLTGGGSGSGDTSTIIKGGGQDLTRSAGQVKRGELPEGTKTINNQTPPLQPRSEVKPSPADLKSSQPEAKISPPGVSVKPPQPEVKPLQPDVKPPQPGKPLQPEVKPPQPQVNVGPTPPAIGFKPIQPEAEIKEQFDQARRELNKLKDLKGKLEKAIETSPALKQFKKQLVLDITSEGLRIQIMDEKNRPMFASGRAELQPYTHGILREIGKVLNTVPNKISLSGHTDATPYPSGAKGYSNWELSADRANASRRELIAGGMNDGKILRVVGLSSAVMFDKKDPFNPINRRISIIVMNKKTEESITKDMTSSIEAGNDPAAPRRPAGVAPLVR